MIIIPQTTKKAKNSLNFRQHMILRFLKMKMIETIIKRIIKVPQMIHKNQVIKKMNCVDLKINLTIQR
jgi:hypothetical protein